MKLRTLLRRRSLWLVGALLVAGVGVFGYRLAFGKAKTQYTTAPVTRGDIESTVVAAGIVQPIKYVDVGAQTSGKLKSLKVNRGDQVEENQLLAEIDPAMGTDLLTIMRGPPAVRASAVIVTSFLPEDLPSIRSVPGVAMAVPETSLSSLLRFGDQDLTVAVVGTGEDFPKVHDWPPQSGVFFSAEHVKRYAQVVVLGQTTAKNLFPEDTNPLGQYVLIGSAPFLVIGVLSTKGLTPVGRRYG